jgi:hypothetical protein
MGFEVEKVWESSGLPCVVIMTDMGHRCGYVGVGPDHILYGLSYSDKCCALAERMKKVAEEPVNIDKVPLISLLLVDEDYLDNPRIDFCFQVHGGLTHAGGDPYPVDTWISDTLEHESRATTYERPWWFGYDCAHAGDGKDLSAIAPEVRKIHKRFPIRVEPIRTLEYCIGECESLASQLSMLDL